VTARPSNPKYLNIGSNDFRHPYWHNLDHPTAFEGFARNQRDNIDIAHDLMSGKPIPVADNSLSIAYCSHVIEHLPDEHVAFLFAEVFRILAPGGHFRIVAPDMHVYYEAYQRGDKYYLLDTFKFHNASTVEQSLLEKFATSLTLNHPDNRGKKFTDQAIAEIFRTMSEEEAYEYFCKQVSMAVQYDYPADHINWFTVPKLLRMLSVAGFTDIWESRLGQSHCPELRETHLFDPYPFESLFVECRK
ncbi:MAG: methyltransferase domain-containing protein, partial [bacterium]|nr:methyltransferase domain-containing protein [bacterium]